MSEKNYYDRYWASSSHADDGWMTRQDPWEEACLRRVLDTAAPFISGNVLDLGCGDGTVSKAVSDLSTVTGITGVDVAEAAVRQAAKAVPSGAFSVMMADALDFPDAHFDTILAVEIVEHLLDIEQVFRELSRVMKPGGHLLVTTTDFNWLKQVIIAAAFFERYFSPTNPHIRFFTRKTLARELGRTGFKEVRHKWNGSYLGIMPKGQIMVSRKEVE